MGLKGMVGYFRGYRSGTEVPLPVFRLKGVHASTRRFRDTVHRSEERFEVDAM